MSDDGPDAPNAVWRLTSGGDDPTPEADLHLGRGSSIGRFVVVDRLGAGGMGVVYSAYDPELDRKIAVKLIRASRSAEAGGASRDRLLREAQAMAKVSHPNVVHVYDVGVWHEQVFVAMELVEGETLGQWMKRSPGDWRATLALFIAAGRGLAAAHAAGLVHRDFKPDNVLVGSDGRVRVTDFGLARPPGSTLLGDEQPAQSPSLLHQQITHTGTLVGTPAYMAPEQMSGEPSDARADLFSFCVAAYEALYGKRPFDEMLPAVAAHIDKARALAPPSASRLPSRLHAALMRGMSARPEERFATMEALLTELSFDPAERRVRRILALAGPLALAVLLVGAVVLRRSSPAACTDGSAQLDGVWDQARRASVHDAFVGSGVSYGQSSFENAARGLDRFVVAWKAMHLLACEATRVRGEQSSELLDLRMQCLDHQRRAFLATTELFSHADAKMVEQAVAATAALGVERCADVNALRGPIHPAVAGPVKRRLDELAGQLSEARAQLGVGRAQDAARAAQAIVDEARAIDDRPLQADALLLLGEAQHAQGKAEAERTLKDCVIAAEASRADPVLAQAWIDLVGVEDDHAVENMAAADESGRHAEAYVSRLDDDRMRYALSMALSALARHQGRWVDADREGARALAAARRAYGEDSPAFATALAAQAQMTSAPGERVAVARRALAITQKLYGAEHPRTAASILDLAAALVAPQGSPENDEAIVQFRRGIAIYERTLGPECPQVAWGLSRLSDVLSDHGQPGELEESIALQKRALRIYRSQNPNGRDVGNALALLAGIYVLNHRWAEALPHLDDAERVFARAMKTTSPYVGWLVHRQRGVSLAGLGRYEAAVVALERALSTNMRPVPDAETKVDLMEALGKRRRSGDLARAVALGREARPVLLADGGGQYKADVARIDRFVARYDAHR